MVRNRGGGGWPSGGPEEWGWVLVSGNYFAKKESVSTPLVFFASSVFLASMRLWRRTFLEGN